MSPVALSRYLGLFSLVLGGMELAMPRTVSRRLGVWGGPWLVRAFGVREMAAGFTVLTDPTAMSGPASRIAGDVLDVAVLLPAALRSGYRRQPAIWALAAVLGVTVLDVICTTALANNEKRRMETAKRTRWVPPAGQPKALAAP